jgi:Ca2+-binding RTX toxin-like protein
MTAESGPKTVETSALAGVSGGNNPFNIQWGSPPGGQANRDDNLSGWDNNHQTSGGNDTIHANGGNDTVDAGDGNDKVTGNAGNDSIIGGWGADELHGDNYGEGWSGGNDTLHGGGGDRAADRVFAGGGDDTYTWSPGDGNDEFQGEGGRDTLVLQGITMEQLANGLNLHQGNLRPEPLGSNGWAFVNERGEAQTISGTFSVNGEMVTFYGVEAIRLG